MNIRKLINKVCRFLNGRRGNIQLGLLLFLAVCLLVTLVIVYLFK